MAATSRCARRAGCYTAFVTCRTRRALTFALFLASSFVGCRAPTSAEGDAGVTDSAHDPALSRVSLGVMTRLQEEQLRERLAELPAPGKGPRRSTLDCLRANPAALPCVRAAEYAAQLTRRGLPADAVRNALRTRYASDVTPLDVAIDGSPTIGPASASVTVVAFIDLDGRDSARLVQRLEQVRADRDAVRVVFKFLPSRRHVYGESATRAAAAVAYLNADRFLPFARTVFDRQPNVSPADIDVYATELGLDPSALGSKARSAEVDARLARDRAAAVTAGVAEAPAAIANGRRVDLESTLQDWIEEAHERAVEDERPTGARSEAR